jgi:hypothetical protein
MKPLAAGKAWIEPRPVSVNLIEGPPLYPPCQYTSIGAGWMGLADLNDPRRFRVGGDDSSGQGQALGPRFHVAFAGVMVTSCKTELHFWPNTKAIAFCNRINLRLQLRLICSD